MNLVPPTPAGHRTSDAQGSAAAVLSVLLLPLNLDTEPVQEVKLQNWRSCGGLQGGTGDEASGASLVLQEGQWGLWNNSHIHILKNHTFNSFTFVFWFI